MSEKKLLTITELKKVIDVKPSQIASWLKRGIIANYKKDGGKRNIYDLNEITAVIKKAAAKKAAKKDEGKELLKDLHVKYDLATTHIKHHNFLLYISIICSILSPFLFFLFISILSFLTY